MGDIDRRAKTVAAALFVHKHICPECRTTYSCNCSEHDRKEKLICINCERKR